MTTSGREGRPTVLATVVASSDSAPRGLGAQLAIALTTTGDLVWTGGLTGGCAEVAVLETARALMDGGDRAARSIELHKDSLGGVGPMCGSVLQVLVERVDHSLAEHLADVSGALGRGASVMGERSYARAGEGLERIGISFGESPMRGSRTVGVEVEEAGAELRAREWIPAPPHVVLCGGGDTTIELIAMMRRLGWRTTLIDPRPSFIQHTLLHTEPDAVCGEWPDAAFASLDVDDDTACVTLAHDEKLDIPFLEQALRTDAMYVGSIGSRRVQAARNEHLAERLGVGRVARHRGPAGLNLGGATAAEIALSVAAELVATWYGRDAGALVESTETIRAR